MTKAARSSGRLTRLLVALGVVFVILIAGTVTYFVVRTTACGCRKLQLGKLQLDC